MTADIAAVLPYGSLDDPEVYFEHDGPKFFSVRVRRFPMYLLAICVDETDEQLVFIYVALSEERFRQVRSGHVTLLDAFSASDVGELWRVIEDYSDGLSVAAEPVIFQELPHDYWPLPDARLGLPTPSAPALDPVELSSWASEGMRFVAAIELDPHGENLTEFPLRGLGQVGTAVQESVDALAQEEVGEPTDRGPIAKRITEDVQLSTLALRAASFAIVVGTDKRGALMDNGPKVQATLDRLVSLIQVGTDPDELVTALRAYGSRARGKFTNLLRAVGSHGSGIGVLTAPQVGPPREGRMTVGEVVRALQAIDNVDAITGSLEIRRGTLTGSNTRRATFELVDNASMNRYSGHVAEAARAQIDGLSVGNSSFVSATLVEEVDFAAEDQETGRKYTLVAIHPLAE